MTLDQLDALAKHYREATCSEQQRHVAAILGAWPELEPLARQALSQQWQPIATHDKSATPIIVALIRDGKIFRVSLASFNGLGYYTTYGGEACHWRTHWTPLPAPPKET